MRRTNTPILRAHRRPSPPRGFTLIELLVSMTGALALSASVFLVAKQTTSLYQQESRVANANMTSIVGFERLRADIARAGFMTSPHITTDTRVCGSTTTSQWPPMLQRLQSLTFGITSSLPAVYADNDLSPQEVVIAGNFTSAEAIPVRSVELVGSNVNVYLQVASGALARLGYSSSGVNQQDLLNTVFPAGRLARIVDRSGRHHYGLITSTTTSPPTVILSTTTAIIQFRDGSTLGCGINGNETGATINTVNFIRYRIGAPATNDYDAVLDVAGPDYDANRRELLRVELDPMFGNGSTLGAEELIAEYAMDLQFRVTVEPTLGNLTYVDEDALLSWAGLPAEVLPGRGPQMVRSVHTWLSVRSREADRAADIPVVAGPRYRVMLGENTYARLRTVQSRVALHNQ
jgi:Tfp pilus assembly protein PilW